MLPASLDGQRPEIASVRRLPPSGDCQRLEMARSGGPTIIQSVIVFPSATRYPGRRILKRKLPMSQRLDVTDSGTGSVPPGPVPHYLRLHYWWAYIHPNAVRMFERAWLVNLILWFNYRRLSEAALTALEASGPAGQLPGRTLQIACVYGDLTARLAQRCMAADGGLDC